LENSFGIEFNNNDIDMIL